MSGQKVTILGAGVAGLTAALTLARHGRQVRVVEQAPELSELGAGLQITPNGMAVLRALGLAEALTARTLPARAARLRDGLSGGDVARLPLAQGYRLTHRVALIEVLADAVRAAGIELMLNAQVFDIVLGPPAEITLSDGHKLQADLLIGADGVKSKLRRLLEPKAEPRFTGQVAWRATLPLYDDLPEEAQVFMGPGRHLVRYPLLAPNGRDRLVNLVAVEERADWAAEGWHHLDAPENLRRAFAGFCPEVQALLERVEAPYLWGLFRHPVAARWHGPGAAILGDAAHATLPFLAQGANMALEDAWVLAEALGAVDKPDKAFARYQAARQPRVSRIVAEASANATRYHLSGLPRLVGYTGLRLISRTAPGVLTKRYDWLYRTDVTAE